MTVTIWSLCVTLLMTHAAFAQGTVEARPAARSDVHGAQSSAEAAYRALREAQYEARLAEQDVLNTRDAYDAARSRAQELERELKAAEQAQARARARVAEAQRRYDEALKRVERAFREVKK